MDDSPGDTPYDDVVIVTTRSRHPSRHGYGSDSDDIDDDDGGGGGDGGDDGNGQNDQEDDDLEWIDWGDADDAAGGDRIAGGTPPIPARAATSRPLDTAARVAHH
jgi:hypothetical protein